MIQWVKKKLTLQEKARSNYKHFIVHYFAHLSAVRYLPVCHLCLSTHIFFFLIPAHLGDIIMMFTVSLFLVAIIHLLYIPPVLLNVEGFLDPSPAVTWREAGKHHAHIARLSQG